MTSALVTWLLNSFEYGSAISRAAQGRARFRITIVDTVHVCASNVKPFTVKRVSA